MLDESNFLKLVGLDFQMHFLKRLAYINAEGLPSERVINDPRHLYVQETSNKSLKVKDAIEHAESLIKQIEIPPPQEWLNLVGLSRHDFIQQNVDLFSVILFSSFDRSLLLANFLLGEIENEKEVTYKKIIKSIRADNPLTAELLSDLHHETRNLADHRNFFSHRGIKRRIGRFSEIHRAKVITRLFNVSVETVNFQDSDAEKELIAELRKEVTSFESIIFRFLDSLSLKYLEVINQLGGIDMPNDDELLRAKLAIEYFQGGEMPEFMASH